MKVELIKDKVTYTLDIEELKYLLLEFGRREYVRTKSFYTEESTTTIKEVDTFLKEEGF